MNLTYEKNNLLTEIETLAIDYLKIDWFINGRIINLHKDGWRFKFSDKKSTLGNCNASNKTILLSVPFIESNPSCEFWSDIIKHEIAHGIDFKIRGTSDHSYIWKNIARMIGCPEKVVKSKIESNPIRGKYSFKCNGCGYEVQKHRITKKSSACSSCCNKYNYGLFSYDYELKLVSNY